VKRPPDAACGGRRRFMMEVEARRRGAIGEFWPWRVLVLAKTREQAWGMALRACRRAGFETRAIARGRCTAPWA
jgi:hypothetical protein